ncbi:chaperone protein DnaJ [Halobacteroides halobius DSM 5150]|uniref:Chaperone protein DnaJ n=1 Tax=Halobacteroides halobius (strain ATCC 35273 / DSM 5150 / MD-1) TaxID=748449 RepID=L0KCM4_HALHC|nr:molecular chaperone DnaJ [Halobacteroides halobius]AGB41808.1 chaperone protein DnaJ [Halobacteroides halobius DSM 5150]
MAKKDYYEILGVDRDASQKEIKKAYRKLSKKYHPDISDHENAEEKFKEVTEAYEILSDEEQKARYDRYGHAGVNQDAGFGGQGQAGGFGGGFEDIFDMFFGEGGRGRRRNGPRKGADLQYRMNIDFEEAAFGAEKEITLPRTEECEVCDGTGASSPEDVESCAKCNGSGEIRYKQNTPFGQMVQTKTCDRCGGTGKFVKEPCSKCNGQGQVKKQRKVSVNIPAGVKDGSKLRIRGEGQAGENGGPAGDLYVIINVKSHEIFEREGDDVICEVPINFVQATLGDEIQVPTLDGKVKFNIPEGTQPGTFFRLKDKGIPHLNRRGRGDQRIKVKVVIPKNLSQEQQDMLKEFADISGEEINPEHKGFWQKIKSFFEK